MKTVLFELVLQDSQVSDLVQDCAYLKSDESTCPYESGGKWDYPCKTCGRHRLVSLFPATDNPSWDGQSWS